MFAIHQNLVASRLSAQRPAVTILLIMVTRILAYGNILVKAKDLE